MMLGSRRSNFQYVRRIEESTLTFVVETFKYVNELIHEFDRIENLK